MTRFPVDGTGRLSSEVEHPTAALTGPAAGDLAGNFPNPTVATVNGHPVASVVSVGSPDTGANAASRIAVAHEAPLNVEWPEYAADPAATDNTAAIQAAINALPSSSLLGHGGKILLPRIYKCSGQLAANSKVGVTLEGMVHQGGYGDTPSSALVFTGLGAGTNLSCIDARSTAMFRLRNLGIRYTNLSYVGKLIDFSHDGSGTDGSSWLIDGCAIGGDSAAGASGAEALLYLDKAIIGSVRDSYLQFAARGAQGNQTGYSNSISFYNCTFDNFTVSALTDADETWTVDSCTFEGTNGGTGGLRRCYYAELAGGGFNGLTFVNNWIGDIVNASFVAIEVPIGASGQGNGLLCLGNNFECNTDAMNFAGGLHGALIAGNRFSSTAGKGIVLATYPPGSENVAIIGNQWSGGGQISNTAIANATALTILGNHGCTTPETVPAASLNALGLLFQSTPDTVTVGTGAGTGATASVSSNGRSGLITLTTGTGLPAQPSQLLKLTFGTAFAFAGITDWAPKIMLQPANANAGDNAPGFWWDDTNGGVTYAELKANAAPGAGTTYLWRYMIVQ